MLKKETIRIGSFEITIRMCDEIPKDRVYLVPKIPIDELSKRLAAHPEEFGVIVLKNKFGI